MPYFEQLLDRIREESKNHTELGKKFENITKEFLTTDRLYKRRFAKVYRWEDWPGRIGNSQTGVDLIAVEYNGELCAIQCKCYEDKTPIDDSTISKFLSEHATLTKGGKTVNMLLAYTGKRLTPAAKRKLCSYRCYLLDKTKFDNGTIDWYRYPKLGIREPEELTDYQEENYELALDELEKNHRGKLTMNRRDGRDLVTLRIAEKLVGTGGVILYILPSVREIRQTIKNWGENHVTRQHYYTVLDEEKATEDGSIMELLFPPTASDKKLHTRYVSTPGMSVRVIFCTCSTVLNVTAALKKGVFELMIYDEIITNKTKKKNNDDCLSLVSAGNVINAAKKLYLESPGDGYKDVSKIESGGQVDYSFSEPMLHKSRDQSDYESDQHNIVTSRKKHTRQRYERGQPVKQNGVLSLAHAVWIAAATLHKTYGKTETFKSSTITKKVKEQGRHGAADISIQQHVTHQCVANARASPATHRILYRVSKGTYRLYCKGDDFHPTRISGKIKPLLRELPDEYKDLLTWYDEEYCASKKRVGPPFHVTAATAVWIATASLHIQHGIQKSFPPKAIIDHAVRQGLSNVKPVTIMHHTGVQCVANLIANPSTHRMLYRTDNKEYRLYRSGDRYHHTRKKGRITPPSNNIPPEHRHLLKWYHDVYCA